jgi:leader peptidase (prepilin peptidase)/N-methyltransferase
MDFSLLLPLVLGWIAGLFINYSADVLPYTRRFSHPACKQCNSTYLWMDYWTLQACRSCGKRRSVRTWLIQFLATASFLYLWMFPSKALGIPLGMIVLTYFWVLSVIDLEHRLILFPTVLFGAVLGLIVGTSIHSRINDNGLLMGMGLSLLGGLFGFTVMFLLYKLGELVARYRARKLVASGQEDDKEEALGGGDVYLAAVLGLMLGWDFIVLGLAWGVIFAGIFSLLYLLVLLIRRSYSTEAFMAFIPYGPFFIFAASLLLFQP